MLDTVLNLGLNDITVEALVENSGDPRFAYDSYAVSSKCMRRGVGRRTSHFEEILDIIKKTKV